jgi:hypothetical protein
MAVVLRSLNTTAPKNTAIDAESEYIWDDNPEVDSLGVTFIVSVPYHGSTYSM